MIPNPYSPGSAPPTFLAGRSKEQEKVRAAAAKVATYGRAAGPLLAFYGPRGVGKTSLLRQAQAEDVLAAGMLSVWVTGRRDHPLLPNLSRAIEQVLEVNRILDQESRLRALLRSAHIQVSGFGVTVGAAGPGTSSSDTDATQTVETLLQETGRFIRDKGYGGLVVFVDEFQDLPLDDRTSLLIALQHFDGDPEHIPVAAVAAGLPSLPFAVTEAATFGERSTFVEIGALSPLAVAEALLEPASSEHVSWTSEAIDLAVEETAGYPHKVQLLGAAAWDEAAPRETDENPTITVHHARAATLRVASEMRTMFTTRLAKTTKAERKFLHAMARVSNHGTAARNQIANELGVEPRSISTTRQQLISKGMIQPAGHGQLRFTLPGFDRFLEDEDPA